MQRQNGRPVLWTGSTFNIKTLGAKGDGKTIDTNAIQNAASSHPGAILDFPAGNYALNNNGQSGLTLIGFTGRLLFEAAEHTWSATLRLPGVVGV